MADSEFSHLLCFILIGRRNTKPPSWRPTVTNCQDSSQRLNW